ncbi:Ephrin type-A receptor 1 [Balamuthia mandrillaris]
MQHLAAYGVVHRDLALRNVLMDFRGKQRTLMPKVTDLGLARQVVGEEVVYNAKSGGKVPVRWTAPEAFKHRRFTSKSDVWSFGIVLWELFSDGALPYFGLSNTEVAEQVSDWGLRLQKPKDCPEPIFSIMTECWHKDPDRRPSFAELFERLQQAERGLIEATAYYEEV